MYHTWIDGKEHVAERLQWVRLQDNGVYVSCSEEEGEGVVLDGEIYHVDGRKNIDRPTVTLVWQEDASKIFHTASVAFAALAQARLLDDATIAEHGELFAQWSTPDLFISSYTLSMSTGPHLSAGLDTGGRCFTVDGDRKSARSVACMVAACGCTGHVRTVEQSPSRRKTLDFYSG